MTDGNPVLAWHFLAANKRLGYGDGRRVRMGAKQVARWPNGYDAPTLCVAGMHGSVRLLDALQYASSAIICRVEIGGRVVRGGDKVCGDWRRVLWMYDASTVMHLFACAEAERALKARRAAGNELDARLWDAIRVKRAWVAGKATDAELDAAQSAARAAERAAAWSAAWDAARAAARAAERAAAWSAARAAAWDAARAAARDAQNKRLTAAIMRGRPR